MGLFFWARINSATANNNVINLTNGIDPVQIEFLNQTIDGDPGDYNLELPADGNGDTYAEIDPDTVIVYNGETYNFSVEAAGTMPTGNNKVPDTLEGEGGYILRLYDADGNQVVRLVIVVDSTDGDPATFAEMQAMQQGNITMDFLTPGNEPPICFQRGTLIATPHGQTPIETLRAGDPVLTLSGAVATVRFVASRAIEAGELLFRPDVRPVCIPAGTLGNGRPSADLWVSPQHRVLVRGWEVEMLFGEAEVLVPAKHLRFAGHVARPRLPEAVEYFHLMLDRHDIVLSNGVETESLYPGDTAIASMTDEGRQRLDATFPEYAGDWSLYGPTARRTLTGREAEALWARMAPLGSEAVQAVA